METETVGAKPEAASRGGCLAIPRRTGEAEHPEEGPQAQLLRGFGLRECPERGYPARTKANVLNSTGTLIVGSREDESGRAISSYLTAQVTYGAM